MNTTAPIDAPLLAAYREHNARQLTRSVMVANIIAMIVVPSGAMLDYFMYPGHFLEFLTIRMGDAVVLFAIIGLLYVGGQRHQLLKAKVLGVLSVLSITGAISLMIFKTEGARSPYFAGVNLAIMCWASLLPWSVVQTVIMCVATLVIYIVACAANPSAAGDAFYPYLGFNASFIVIASIICVGMTMYLSRVRFEDFRLRHQLDAQNRELQDLDRVKTQFFSNVSHELRTPLTLILGPVETLLTRADTFDSRTHESLMLVHRNTLRLLKLINDLLDLTRLDLAGETLRRKRFRLGSYVKGVVDSVRHLGLAKQLRIKVDEGDAALEAVADPVRLEKVLLNLLTNALKYTPAGGAITVRWSGDSSESILEVEDNGVGIPAEDLPRIFDRFHQVRTNASNQNQGIGIGLALAKELAEQHGGGIEVRSEIGKGTTFRVHIPVGMEDASDELAPAVAIGAVEEPFEKAFRSADRAVRSGMAGPDDEDQPVVGKGERVVLVADDEDDMRQFVVSLLSEDYRVVQTRHGGNVSRLVAAHSPDIVLLDWMMPGKTGLEICQELRADEANRDRKIMLLTARIDEESKIEALRSGADDFLTKPFSSVEVKTRVDGLIRAASLQKDLRARNGELAETIEKLQRTEFLLIQSEKMNAIGSLSAGLLHEINNPLNYTLAAIGLVERHRESLSADVRELVDDIEEGMMRVRDVITHLKGFAYPEKPDHQSLFPIADAFQDARKLSARELMDIRIDASIPADIVVRGQRTQLTHVFINLLANSAKALGTRPAGQPKVVTVQAEAADGMLRIEVADNGPGIAPETMSRIFEPFFTTAQVGSGMGMGLSVCHSILEAHGGGIRAGNRAEGGAVFSIHLPLPTPALESC